MGFVERLTQSAWARALATLGLIAMILGGVSLADGKMRTKQLSPKLCQTTGGGKFVKIPGFPGEKIDRRLKRDIRFLVRRYKIFITDGHSLNPVHSANGEHPIGLALDIVPGKGGSWRKITKLAKWAEPTQNQPRAPFRWVGYDGDAGHGRGHHLHLSWSHSPTSYNKPAKTVWSIKCPRTPKPVDDGTGGDTGGGGGGGSTGGIGYRAADLDRVHRESGGVSLR